MTDYDAIVVGAGHNGLTAAAILQQAGLRTVCLEANTYTGGMAATVELIDGFRYEIAGSVQFPMPSQIAKELGLDTLPTVDADVMSVNLGDEGEEPMIFYRDPMQFMTHLADKHGTDAVAGMAGLIGWSQGPAKALGRFDVRTPPKTLDEMYACASSEAERTAIHDVLFGTAMDAIDRYLPDKHKHAVLRSMLAFLAINSTYRGPYTPGSATCLAFALAVPDDTTAMMTKLEGGIGALCEHLHQLFVSNGGRGQVPRQGGEDSPHRRPRHRRASARRIGDHRAGGRVQPLAGPHIDRSGRRRASARRPGDASERARPPGVVRPDPLRARRPARVRAALRLPQRTRHARLHRNLQFARRTATPVGRVQARHRPGQSVDGNTDPVSARRRHGAARQACRKRVRLRVPSGDRPRHARPTQERDGGEGDRQDHPVRPELPRYPDTPHHICAVSHANDVRRPVR